jgi:hypothetical protein
MFGDPRVGRSAEQEHCKGHAEDHFKVMSLSASVAVPYGRFHHAMRIVAVKGPREVLKLVQIIRD